MGTGFKLSLVFDDKEDVFSQRRGPWYNSEFYKVKLKTSTDWTTILGNSYGVYGELTSTISTRYSTRVVFPAFDVSDPAINPAEAALPPSPPTNTQEYIEQRRTITERVSDFISAYRPDINPRSRR